MSPVGRSKNVTLAEAMSDAARRVSVGFSEAWSQRHGPPMPPAHALCIHPCQSIRLQMENRQHGLEALEAGVTIEIAIPRKIGHAQSHRTKKPRFPAENAAS
jgi:hypothetical protein